MNKLIIGIVLAILVVMLVGCGKTGSDGYKPSDNAVSDGSADVNSIDQGVEDLGNVSDDLSLDSFDDFESDLDTIADQQ